MLMLVVILSSTIMLIEYSWRNISPSRNLYKCKYRCLRLLLLCCWYIFVYLFTIFYVGVCCIFVYLFAIILMLVLVVILSSTIMLIECSWRNISPSRNLYKCRDRFLRLLLLCGWYIFVYLFTIFLSWCLLSNFCLLVYHFLWWCLLLY